jgi:hypothetical protein
MRLKLDIPASSQATASPSMQERERNLATDSTIREAICQVVTGPAVEPHPIALLASDYSEAVVLDLVNP